MSTEPAPVRAGERMSLLGEVVARSLDPGYAAAAARRGERSGGDRHRHARSLLVLVLAVSIGLGGVWAARELRTPVPSALSARGLLVDEIQERSDVGADLVERNASLRGEIRLLQQQSLGADADATFDLAQDYGVWAGTTEVTGPGVVLALEDSERAQAGEPGTELERVQDFDLQVVVNGLWACGAEAVTVNGIRLTGATAIRSAGQTVLVDTQPLASPYRVEAIGDPQEMRVGFAATAAAAHLSALGAQYGITSGLSPADDLVMPAGTAPLPGDQDEE